MLLCRYVQPLCAPNKQAAMAEKSKAALGGGSINWDLASQQHSGYVDALSKIVDAVEVRLIAAFFFVFFAGFGMAVRFCCNSMQPFFFSRGVM